MTLLDLSARPVSPSTLPAFSGPSAPAPARGTSTAKIVAAPAVTVTAGLPPRVAPQQTAAGPVLASAALRKAPARKRTRKFVPDYLAKEAPPRHAATLDSFQLNAALDTMFRLDGFASELETIARLRREHPNELIVAERMTGWHLGSAGQFKARATALFFASPAGACASAVSPTKVRLWAVSLAAAPLLTGGAAIAATADGALALAVGALTALISVVGVRRPESSGVPELVDADWAHLRRDVVDASLAAVIKERNQPLSAEEEAALTRGFEHLRHIGLTAAAMAGPAAPVRKVRARQRGAS
ncbi:MAG TPA: hypothetical protein VF885_15885 [Arthrobacter sp.]